MIQWSRVILERFVAPEFSDFVTADIPDMGDRHPEARHWLANYFLNSALSGSFKDGVRQAAIAYLRRAHHAYEAYASAREATLAYLENINPTSPPITKY